MPNDDDSEPAGARPPMTEPSDRNQPPSPTSAQPAPAIGFVRVLGAVFASFLGIRRRAHGERDMATIKPVHVIVAGVLGAALFVAVLVVLVGVITRKV